MSRARTQEFLNSLVPWPAETLGIDYVTKDDVVDKIGAGERRLVAIYGGDRPQGGSKNYDIVTGTGTRLEVKEPDSNLQIVTAASGTDSFVPYKVEIEKVLFLFEEVAREPLLHTALQQLFSREFIAFFDGFCTDDIPNIKRGEISKGRFERLTTLIYTINRSLFAPERTTKVCQINMKNAGINIERSVDTLAFSRVGTMLGLTQAELDINPQDALEAALNAPAFRDPEPWLRSVWSLRASRAFEHVDGIVLVHPYGYRFMLINEVDQVLALTRVSRGRPHFIVTPQQKG